MTLEEKLSAAEARLAELDTQLAAERASVASLQQRLQEAETARDEESAINGQLQGELKTLRQQHTDAAAKIAKLEANAKTAEAKAAEICASVGVEPLPVTSQGDRDSASSTDLTEQLRAQKSPAEQTAFWRKNKSRILNRS
jgi:chromosome segregation ATPase